MLQLLEELKIRNIHLSVKNDNLVIDTKDDVEEDLINQIKVYKQEIISYILKHSSNRIIKNTSISNDHPVSDAQKRLWLQSITEERSKAYHLKYPVEVPVEYRTEIVRSSVLQLVNDYEIFRTVFRLNNDGEVRQVIVDQEKNTFDIDIVNFKDEKNCEKLIEEKIDYLNSFAFDLSKGPLLRCIIFELKDKTVLYFIFHHIIMDGVSSVLLKQKIFDYYNALSNSEDVESPTLQYLDYTYWKQSNIDNGNYNNSRNYWLNLLSKNIPVIDLPSSLSRPHTTTFNSFTLKTDISQVLTQKLDDFSKLNQGTLYVGVLSVINILLNKYTSARDITLGTFTSGRNHPEIDEMLGLFVNTIALNNVINPEEDTFSDVFRKTKESFTQAFSHQDYPFEMLVEDLQLTHNTGRNPLFDITVVFQDYINEDSDDNVLFSEEIKEFGARNRAFDVNFEVINRGAFLTLITAFNTDIYEKEMLSSFINHFKNLLNALVNSPDIALSKIDYLRSEEKELLLKSFNATEIDYPEEETIVSLFEKQVDTAPDRTALVYDDITLTYRELNERSNRLAHYLREQYNIHPNDLIGIQLPRGVNMIISILGILKSGAAYVPVSPDYPQERKDYILDDTQARVNINEAFLLEFEISKSNYSIQNPDSVIKSDDLAYIIYTSGTTGNPKGVMVEHDGVVNLILDLYRRYGLNDDDVLLQSANYTFDASVEQIFLAILNGNSLFLIKDKILLDENAFLQKLSDHNVSYVHLTPSLLQSIDITKAHTVRILNSGGESLPLNLYNKLKDGAFLLINSFGPTETTVTSIVNIGNDTNNIGQPIANTQIYILDEYRHLVPTGVSGEMYISGSGLARGYLNREDLTAEKFVSNPFIEGTKMYRTGDLGRWLLDGNIEYLGRIDHQVKIRGHRIELGEIDSQVLSFSEAIKSVVTEVKEHDGDKSLVVYYVSDTPIDKQDLSRYLESKLPQYMLPSFYVELDHIPLTSNGKIDRKNLREVSSEDMIRTEYVSAETGEEKALVEVCEEVLKHHPISIRDNYYNLGGDSIKSIQIVSRLRQRGYNLKVEHILQYPVFEELSRYITSDVVLIDQSVIMGSSILTPIQRYFFESEDIVNKNYYNQCVILKSTERLSGSVLESSLHSLVSHHDALRMEYHEDHGLWSQYNQGTEGKHYHFAYFDVRDSGDGSEEVSRLKEIGESLQNSIDIESGILFHVGHVSMSDGDRLLLIIHHLVVDGVSWRILLEDLGNLYESGIKGASYELPSKTDSFQSWGTALEDYGNGSALSKEVVYWKYIESEVYPSLPTDYPVVEKHIFDKTIGFTFTKEQTRLLQTLAGKQYSAEINDVLLTGLALSLQENFGINKTKILMEGHGREVLHTGLDISRTVGWFTSVYPFSLDISNGSQPVLVSVKEALRGIPHKGIGYGILKYLGQGLSSAERPSVQFNYLGDFDDTTGSLFHYTTEDIGYPVSEDNQGTDILLDVSGMTVNGEMSINLRYSGNLFNESTVQKLVDSYQVHLEQMIIADEEQKVILTSSDLTYKGLSFTTIQEISKDRDIEDIYELSPMQQGLYYHWLVDSKGSAYFMQTSYRIRSENLDLSKVEKAFGKLLNRYTILRTSFDNRYGDVPLQIVHKQAKVDFKHLILESDLELDNIKQGDIARGFDLNDPTQMRLLVVELPDNSYEFIWSYHHIIMDGWCLSILINDFSVILNSLQQGLSLSLSEPEKYSSYIKWLEGVDKEEAMVYWENYLKGINTPTLIPFEKQDRGEASHYLAETLVVENNDFQEIDTFCQYLGITLNTYVQGVWSYLLSSYNRSEDVVFGSVVSGRPADLEGVENMVGLFINTIPVRVSFDKDETPRSLLKKLHRDSIQSIGYHFTGLSEIQSLSSLGKELINNVVVFENYAKQRGNDENSSITGLTGQNVDVFEQTNYAFTMVAIPDESSLSMEFRYDSSVFDPSSILSLVSHFKQILHQFVGASDMPLSELDYVETEEKAILESFSYTGKGYEVDKTIVSLFEEQVLRTPNHIAVVYEELSLSYSVLNSESNQLAHYLREKYAIQEDDLICIRLPRSENMIVSILGVLKSGGAYVPIDTDYPQERIDFILNDTQCKVTIDEALLLEFEALKENYSTENPEFIIKPHHLAYIIYTSGTTGTPKGVMIEHKNVVRLLFNDDTLYNFSSNDSWTLFHSYNFDFSVWECYGALLFGGKLHVISRQLAQDPGAFLNYVIENKITVLNQTPAAFYNLSKYDHQLNKKQLSLRYIIFGGEVLNPVMLRDWQIKYPAVKMVNMYGPTESTVFASKFKIERENVLESVVLPIGKPLYDTPIYILDEYGHLAPVGVPGELHIAGAGLARGYLNRAELTAEKFVSNPFVEGTKMYCTGDLGKWLPDGNIEYLGRVDHQVKIRGHRIELGEIDSQVLSYNGKIKAVVTEVKEHEGDKNLVVYYVSDSSVDKKELAQYLEAQLPRYMIPSFYVELENIPLTNNGKIAREKLPEISSSDLINKEYIAPKTDLEKQLVEIWEEILGISNIGITDNFFELGGNSMNVIRIIGEIQNKMGKLINVGAFLEAPTITELVMVINTLDSEEKKVFKTII